MATLTVRLSDELKSDATNVEWLSRPDGLASGPAVSYCWTADGEPERCYVEGHVFEGEECYHCHRPINGRGVRLLADDGDVYDLHAGCARWLRCPRRGGN